MVAAWRVEREPSAARRYLPQERRGWQRHSHSLKVQFGWQTHLRLHYPPAPPVAMRMQLPDALMEWQNQRAPQTDPRWLIGPRLPLRLAGFPAD
jgi:hypothetical protein